MKKITTVKNKEDLQELLNRICSRISNLEEITTQHDHEIQAIEDLLITDIPPSEMDS